MEERIRNMLGALAEKDDSIRYEAFTKLMDITESPVDWVYAVWDTLAAKLDSDNSYQRSIGMSLLCNLARSDKEKRAVTLLPKILSLSQDGKFITRRQTLQALWKIAWFEPETCEAVVKKYIERFHTCVSEEHPNLLQRDIIQSLLTLAELRGDEALFTQIDQLIQSETDEKTRKTFLALKKKKK
jgi:hypothetical protein